MTKFKTLKSINDKEKETVFNCHVTNKDIMKIEFEETKANSFDEVIYLGKSIHYGDTFLCRSLSKPNNFGIYFGEVGTEFNNI